MFNRFILVADLSPESFAVVNSLEGLKTYGGKHCLLLLCLSFQETVSVALSRTTAILENTLHQLKEILEKKGFMVEARVVPGFAKQEINWVATEENYSLIVVGSLSRSLVAEFFLKGAANDVIHHCRKPVLLIRPQVNPGEGHEEVQAAPCYFTEHVLFPTDFSKSAEHAFIYVQKLAADGARQVTLLHVRDKARIDFDLKHRKTEFNENDRERLETMRKILQEKGKADIGIEVCYGSPSAEIIRLIRERKVHLVVMGSRGCGFVKELFLGSVSHEVARHPETSVLLITAEVR